MDGGVTNGAAAHVRALTGAGKSAAMEGRIPLPADSVAPAGIRPSPPNFQIGHIFALIGSGRVQKAKSKMGARI